MPRATVSVDTEKHDLKTLEEGFVELRKLSYGEVQRIKGFNRLSRSANTTNGKDDGISFEMAFEETRYFEFSRAIVDHNLEDENGNKLDFKNRKHVLALDPVVGQEIEDIIDTMNTAPEGEERVRFPQTDS